MLCELVARPLPFHPLGTHPSPGMGAQRIEDEANRSVDLRLGSCREVPRMPSVGTSLDLGEFHASLVRDTANR
jgi:hypothetical protein